MSHPLLIALFDQPAAAAEGARALRSLGVPPAKVSVVAATHDEEGVIARVADATPGSELEDSRSASRLGELGAHLLAAVALVVPGIGPIVADGPLAAGLGEVAGHLAGGLGRALERAGLPHRDAEMWEQRVKAGGVLIGAHLHDTSTDTATERLSEALRSSGASLVTICQWPE